MLYYLRNRLWDVSCRVKWLDAAQPYYEIPGKTDRYDAEKCPIESLSTFKRPTSRDLIQRMKEEGARSVLDIGCGAGAFYKLARDAIPGIHYHGIDASKSQIERARENYGALFTLGDASAIDADYIRNFDAVHAYSVFAFMSVAKQLRLLRAIMESGALVNLEIGATRKRLSFVPQTCFKNHGKAKMEGGILLTAVSFPYQHEIERLIRAPYALTWAESTFGRPHSVNLSGKDGGAIYHGRKPKFLRKLKTMKMLRGLIVKT